MLLCGEKKKKGIEKKNSMFSKRKNTNRLLNFPLKYFVCTQFCKQISFNPLECWRIFSRKSYIYISKSRIVGNKFANTYRSSYTGQTGISRSRCDNFRDELNSKAEVAGMQQQPSHSRRRKRISRTWNAPMNARWQRLMLGGCRTISKRRLKFRIFRKSSVRGMILRVVEEGT